MSEDVFAPDVPTLVARIEAFIGPIGDYAAKVRAAGGVAAMEPHTRWHVEGTPETFVRAPPGETREQLMRPIAEDRVRIAIIYPGGDAQVLEGTLAELAAFHNRGEHERRNNDRVG